MHTKVKMDLKSLIEKEIASKKRDVERFKIQLERKIARNSELATALQENLDAFEFLRKKHPQIQIKDWSTKAPHFVNIVDDSDYSNCNVHIYIDKYYGIITAHRYDYVKVGDRNIRVYKENSPVTLISYDQPGWRFTSYGSGGSTNAKTTANIKTDIADALLQSKYKSKIRKALVDIITGKYPNCVYNGKANYVGVPEKIKKLINFA